MQLLRRITNISAVNASCGSHDASGRVSRNHCDPAKARYTHDLHRNGRCDMSCLSRRLISDMGEPPAVCKPCSDSVPLGVVSDVHCWHLSAPPGGSRAICVMYYISSVNEYNGAW